MDKLQTLTMLREALPEMECIPGCTHCCANVPWSKTEWGLLSADEREKLSIHNLVCPFKFAGGCEVYEDRAFTCRYFAVVEGVDCPRGLKISDPLPTAEIAALMQTYQKELFNGG